MYIVLLEYGEANVNHSCPVIAYTFPEPKAGHETGLSQFAPPVRGVAPPPPEGLGVGAGVAVAAAAEGEGVAGGTEAEGVGDGVAGAALADGVGVLVGFGLVELLVTGTVE